MTQSSWPVSTRGDLGTKISSREIVWAGAPPGKGRQIRRLPQTSGWVFIVDQTEKYCFIAFYVGKRYLETKRVAIILLKSKFSLE